MSKEMASSRLYRGPVVGLLRGFSQSGSFVDYLVWFLAEKGLRFSSIVSCGNEADLAAEDYLEYGDENPLPLEVHRFDLKARKAEKFLEKIDGGSGVYGGQPPFLVLLHAYA